MKRVTAATLAAHASPGGRTRGGAARAAAVVFGALLLALTGCSTSGDLQRDQRLRFTAPAQGARLATPVAVRWSMPASAFRPVGFDGSGDPHRGVYAVFVDSAPMAPGRHLDTLAEGDRVCETSPGCPDATWLAEHGVYLTKEPQLLLRALPPSSGRKVDGGRRHLVTVVLLNGRGVRIGEAAWTRSFATKETGE